MGYKQARRLGEGVEFNQGKETIQASTEQAQVWRMYTQLLG